MAYEVSRPFRFTLMCPSQAPPPSMGPTQSSSSVSLIGSNKKEPLYTPQVEAISPTLPNDDGRQEQSIEASVKAEQDFLSATIQKIDREIAKTQKELDQLRSKKADLEAASRNAPSADQNQENVGETKQLSIAKLIYYENRLKAAKAHNGLKSANYDSTSFNNSSCNSAASNNISEDDIDLPLYNQPSDNGIYHQNLEKFRSTFKTQLIEYFRKRNIERRAREETVIAEYDQRMRKWLQGIQEVESQPAKRAKDNKLRDFFEKQFPELKKQREDKERFSRAGQRVARSDAELEEIMDGIQEQEQEDKRIKSYAVIPPMLELMRYQKPHYVYINRNGTVEDMVSEHKEHQMLNVWTDEEKDIFRERYLQHPKNFGYIASFCPRKRVQDCVYYYYMSKKSENYKQLLKRQAKRRTRSLVKPSQQQQQQQAAAAAAANASSTYTRDDNTDNQNTDNANGNNVLNNNQPSGDSALGQSSSVNAANLTDSTLRISPEEEMNVDVKTESAGLHSFRQETLRPGETDFSDNKENTANVNAQTCCICNCMLDSRTNQSRIVTRTNHQLYGISVDDLRPGLKICFSCRFRDIDNPSTPEIGTNDDSMQDSKFDNFKHTVNDWCGPPASTVVPSTSLGVSDTLPVPMMSDNDELMAQKSKTLVPTLPSLPALPSLPLLSPQTQHPLSIATPPVPPLLATAISPPIQPVPLTAIGLGPARPILPPSVPLTIPVPSINVPPAAIKARSPTLTVPIPQPVAAAPLPTLSNNSISVNNNLSSNDPIIQPISPPTNPHNKFLVSPCLSPASFAHSIKPPFAHQTKPPSAPPPPPPPPSSSSSISPVASSIYRRPLYPVPPPAHGKGLTARGAPFVGKDRVPLSSNMVVNEVQDLSVKRPAKSVLDHDQQPMSLATQMRVQLPSTFHYYHQSQQQQQRQPTQHTQHQRPPTQHLLQQRLPTQHPLPQRQPTQHLQQPSQPPPHQPHHHSHQQQQQPQHLHRTSASTPPDAVSPSPMVIDESAMGGAMSPASSNGRDEASPATARYAGGAS